MINYLYARHPPPPFSSDALAVAVINLTLETANDEYNIYHQTSEWIQDCIRCDEGVEDKEKEVESSGNGGGGEGGEEERRRKEGRERRRERRRKRKRREKVDAMT